MPTTLLSRLEVCRDRRLAVRAGQEDPTCAPVGDTTFFPLTKRRTTMLEYERRVLPSLTALRAFEALGRTGSVRKAGDELGVSPTVVSRHLRHLQDSIGLALVRPDGRGLSLTPEGKAYHREVEKAFALLRNSTAAMRSGERRRLDVWCTPGIVSRRLLPHLPRLGQELPRYDINIHPTLARPDMALGEADAAILYSDASFANDNCQSVDLIRPRVFPVASPAFMDRHPEITTVDRLAKGMLLHEESIAHWEAWFAEVGLPHPPPMRGQRLWHAHLTIEAALLGQGIALANELLVTEEMQSGRLVEPLPSDVRIGSYQLIALEDRWNEPALRSLRRWLHEVLCLPPTDA